MSGAVRGAAGGGLGAAHPNLQPVNQAQEAASGWGLVPTKIYGKNAINQLRRGQFIPSEYEQSHWEEQGQS